MVDLALPIPPGIPVSGRTGNILSASLNLPGELPFLAKQVNSPGALVIEDPPRDPSKPNQPIIQERLDFQSYPRAIEEVYQLAAYREIAGNRMPQPGFVGYRGGNWGDFPLELQFRAGIPTPTDPGTQFDLQQEIQNIALMPIAGFDTPTMQQILIENELNVRWCQAIAFPLQRTLGNTAVSQVTGPMGLTQSGAANVSGAGTSLQSATTQLAKLGRFDPPIILIQFGTWLTIRGFVKNVRIRWEEPFHPRTGRAYGATVSFNFQPMMSFYPNFQSIAAMPGGNEYLSRLQRLRAVADQNNASFVNQQNNLANAAGG